MVSTAQRILVWGPPVLLYLITQWFLNYPRVRGDYPSKSCTRYLYCYPFRNSFTNTERIMWGIQRGTSVVPKTVSPVRIKENFELAGWGLSNHEMDLLNGCTIRFKSCNGRWLPGKFFFEGGD